MNNIFTKSEKFKQEYSATIVKVGELKDIENSDNLKQVIVDGFSVVVNKNDVKEGDYMIYCRNETALNAQFLSVNNMFEIGERHLNENASEVEKLIDEGKTDEAKKLVGYFNKHGRVKMIKLRGCPSMGVLLRLESLINWDSTLADVKLEDYVKYDENGNFIPFDFDTVNENLFIKAYVPKTNACRSGGGTGQKKDKTNRFDRMLEGEWSFHYDTNQLNSNMWKFSPEDVVDISVKVHGTSICLGNILVKRPSLMNRLRDFLNSFKDKKINKYERQIREIEKSETISDADKATGIAELKYNIDVATRRKIHKFDTEHCNVYSSRTVIKNQYADKEADGGFCPVDVWGEYNELLKGKIPHDVTIYGEIVGHLTDSEKMIQKGYDYGCPTGTNKLMIYRVNEKLEDGTHREYEISEVIEFIDNLVKTYPEISERIMPFTLLYHGTLADLYPHVDKADHWNENILEALKMDKQMFGMELDEPLCKNKVPREGICVRIANDPVKECFKLKCLAFLGKEAKEIDKGEVDIEMMDTYVQNDQ